MSNVSFVAVVLGIAVDDPRIAAVIQIIVIKDDEICGILSFRVSWWTHSGERLVENRISAGY